MIPSILNVLYRDSLTKICYTWYHWKAKNILHLFYLKPFLNLSPFSWRIFDVKISTPTCTPLQKSLPFFNLTLDCLLNLQEKYDQCINFGAICKLEPKRVTHLGISFDAELPSLLYLDYVTHLGLIQKLTPNIFSSKIRHENDDIFKNG
jgi:hypothetical protein